MTYPFRRKLTHSDARFRKSSYPRGVPFHARSRHGRVALIVALACFAGGAAGFTSSTGGASPPSGPQLTIRSFHSNALRRTEQIAVSTPAGYAYSRKRYPVIYYLHGLPGNATSFNGPRIRRLAGSVQRSGRPAIVVAIQGARAGDTDPEWHDWGPGRNWETVVASETVQFMDRNYHTIANRWGRAIIGLSAGGYGAGIIGFHHPGTYSVVEAWSGYFHPTIPSGEAPESVGNAAADRRASVHSYVERAMSTYKRQPTYFAFFVGDGDSRFLQENEQLDQELGQHGVPHTFALYKGGHTGGFWDLHEDAWITAALKHLARPR